MAAALADVTNPEIQKVLASRYTGGLHKIGPARARALSDALNNYADAVESAMGVRADSSFSPFPE